MQERSQALTPRVPNAQAPLSNGTVLSDTYRIVGPLASGGMGDLYFADHTRLPGRFAIKVLQADLIHDTEALSRFQCEAEIMASLRHPHVVQVLDFNIADTGAPYLVMELVEGTDLSAHLALGHGFPPLRVAMIVSQIASALSAAHACGVVHRDLKPENILLLTLPGQEDFVKVADFGICKTPSPHRITADRTIVGTPQFMAPEQAQGRRDEIDHRTDQFALAALAYNLLTGREPFRADSPVAVLYQVVHDAFEPVSAVLQVPCEHIDAVLERALAKARDERFDDVIAFARALAHAIALDLPQHTQLLRRSPVPAFGESARAPRPRSTTHLRIKRHLSGAIVACILAATALLWMADEVHSGGSGRRSLRAAMNVGWQQARASTASRFARWRGLPAPPPIDRIVTP